MKNIIISIVAFFFFSVNFLNAQAWAKNGSFTEGAKIALHRVWGESMGFASPEETAKEAMKIYNSGKFENKLVRNSGVKADGTITRLPNGTYQVVYLGSTDATLLGGREGETANLYLKKDCINLDWIIVRPQPKEDVIIDNYKPTPTPSRRVDNTPQPKCVVTLWALMAQTYSYGPSGQMIHSTVVDLNKGNRLPSVSMPPVPPSTPSQDFFWVAVEY